MISIMKNATHTLYHDGTRLWVRDLRATHACYVAVTLQQALELFA